MARKVRPVEIIPAPCSSDDETEDQNGSSSSTDDEQHAPHPQKPQEHEESDDEPEPEPVVKKPSLQEPQESDDSDNSLSASAFTVKPVVPKSPEPKTPSSKPTRVKSRAKRPAVSEKIDNASKPVSKNQEPGKVKEGSSKRPAEVVVEKIDKVKKSKKSKVSIGDGQSVGDAEKGSKRKKVVSGAEEAGEIEEKKSLIKWSEKDEIVVLGRIIDYKVGMGDDWNSKMDAFYGFVKDLLSVNLTKNQLSEKVRRLKKKFQTNAGNCHNGEEPVFSRRHENRLFELSQKIWGSEGTVTEENDSKVKTSKRKRKKDWIVDGNTSTPLKSVANREDREELFVHEEVKNTIMEIKKEETRDFWSLYPRLCASLESEASGYLAVRERDIKEYVKEIINAIGEEKAKELEDDWKAVFVMDHQLYARRAHLINKQAEAMLDSSWMRC